MFLREPSLNLMNTVKWFQVLTSYLGLRDEQLSPPGGRGSYEEKKEEKGG